MKFLPNEILLKDIYQDANESNYELAGLLVKRGFHFFTLFKNLNGWKMFNDTSVEAVKSL